MLFLPFAFHELFTAHPSRRCSVPSEQKQAGSAYILYLSDTSGARWRLTGDGWLLTFAARHWPPPALVNLILAAIRCGNGTHESFPNIARLSTSTGEYVCMSEHIKIFSISPGVSALSKTRQLFSVPNRREIGNWEETERERERTQLVFSYLGSN